MPFDVSRFRSAFSGAKQDYVIAPSNYFEVQFMDLPRAFNRVFKPGSEIQKQLANQSFENMRFRCHQADLPSKNITSQQRQLLGPVRQMPFGATYNVMMLDFIETPRFNIRAFFDAWLDLLEASHNDYLNEYYDDIIMPEVRVVMYTRDGQKVAQWVLKDVFPTNINQSSVAWENTDSTLMVGVELMYHKWESKWFEVKRSNCDFGSNDNDFQVRNTPQPTPQPSSAPINITQEPPIKQRTPTILRNEYGEPYIVAGEGLSGTKQLSSYDLRKHENVTINTDTWHNKSTGAPVNKI